MLKHTDRGRRLWFAAGLAGALALFVAGLAFAAAPIVGQADNTFSAPVYTIDQGEVGQLQVTGSDHNATAQQNGPDGQALFRSPTIESGAAAVQGTQYLSAGDYSFFCTVHPTTMQATLHVTSAGTPQARPQVSLNVNGKSLSLSKVLKKGLTVSVQANTAINGASLTAKLGKATIGKTTASLAAGTQKKVIKLSKSGKSKLRGKTKASIKVTADIPFGSPASLKTTIK
jgi:plastocyanin